MNQRIANLKAAEIEKDIMLGEYDRTLAKYRPKQSADPEWESTVDLFQLFIDRKRSEITGQTISARYQSLLTHLMRFGSDIKAESDARQFMDSLRANQLPQTTNSYLILMKAFMRWAIEQGHVESNPFEHIKPAKVAAKRVRKREGFNREEVRRILDTALIDRHLSYYHDFIYALFSLGARPSEVIGLRWQDIDWAHQQARIYESLSRGKDGRSSGSARERKVTKTGTTRVVPITSSLLAILQKRKSADAKPDDLVFTAPQGGAIDDHSFSQRPWKRLLEKAGIDHQSPYACRHTCLSHMHQDGVPLAQIAKIAGHQNIRMLSEVYVHAHDLPQMPEYD